MAFGLYAADGSIRTTTVANTVWTGTHAADGSINVVLDDNTRTGLYAKCGAYRVNSTTGTGRSYDPSGAFYIDTLLGGAHVISLIVPNDIKYWADGLPLEKLAAASAPSGGGKYWADGLPVAFIG
jgi:hypothetical protein